MVLNSTMIANSLIGKNEKSKSPQIVINITNFKDKDLEDYVNISEAIERTKRQRRLQKRRSRSHSNTLIATMTREEIFESTNIDDDQYLEAMEHGTSYDAENDLANSIEHLMKYFDEDVNVHDDNLCKDSLVKKFTKGKVASAVASIRNKCNFTPTSSSSSSSRNKSQQEPLSGNIQEIKRKYQNQIDAEATGSASRVLKTKSPRTKVKQMASLFNSKINSVVEASTPEAKSPEAVSPGLNFITSPTCTSTLKPKPKSSPKLKPKFPNFTTKLPSPKPSPLFKKKPIKKSTSVSPVTQRKLLQKESNTTCLVAENVFSQLSVKDKVLLYNKFIADMSNKNPKFSKHAAILESNAKKEMQRGEVVVEKQDSVKHLKESFEAKLAPNKSLAKTLQRFKGSTSKLSLDISPKSKEYEDILQADTSSRLANDSQDPLHVSTLTVILKPSPESKTLLRKNKSLYEKKDTNFRVEPSYKRTQRMIRSSFCVEPLAPPKKIRRTQHERLAPKTFFQNQHLEKLFYHWLEQKNGVTFDIIPVNNKNDVIEIVPKNMADDILLPKEVEKILEAAIRTLDSGKEETDAEDNAMEVIKNTLDIEKSLNQSVVEIELPLDNENSSVAAKDNEIEASDLGLTYMTKTTSEDSQIEFTKAHALSKALRKKKLRRSLTTKKDNSVAQLNGRFCTDSDSDGKTHNTKSHSYTLPRSQKSPHHVKNLMLKSFKAALPSEHAGQLKAKLSSLELDKSWIEQVNSPSKIKSAYTLTVMSPPSTHSECDCSDCDLLNTASTKKPASSWPSSLEVGLNANETNRLKSVSTESTHLTKSSLEREEQKLLLESFIDQGFETGSNDVGSPLSLGKKEGNNTTNTTLSEVNQSAANSPISFESLLTKSASSPDLHTSDSEEKHRTASSLNKNDSQREFREDSLCNQFNYPLESSQFWVTSGDFTASITIHHYDSEFLKLLSNIYAQKGLETMEMNFGIDDQKFCMDSTATPDEIINNVPKEDNYSQYWFSTGDILIPFRGKQMTTKKIHSFFNYIRECMEETGSIRFGIDNYEFSDIYQRTQCDNSSLGRDNSVPLKTSDLDQSDTDLEDCEQNQTFSAVNKHLDNTDALLVGNQQPLDKHEPIAHDAARFNLENIPNDKQDLPDLAVPVLEKRKKKSSKFKLNSKSTNVNKQKPEESHEFSDYMRTLRRKIKTMVSLPVLS